VGAADGLSGSMTAASVTSRSVSLTPQDGGGMQAAFSMAGDATGEGLPVGCTYSVQGTASTNGGRFNAVFICVACVPHAPAWLRHALWLSCIAYSDALCVLTAHRWLLSWMQSCSARSHAHQNLHTPQRFAIPMLAFACA